MNRHVIIGYLGGNSEMFTTSNFRHGKQIAAELRQCKIWQEVYEGSLLDLLSLLKEKEE